MNLTIKVKVKFIGIFRGLSKRSQLPLELEGSPSLKDVVQKTTELFPPEFKRILIDPELDDPRPNALILLNGRDISVLDGFETRVDDGDEVVFIPVSHGG
jgi:molybdopterin converting factor small subunit